MSALFILLALGSAALRTTVAQNATGGGAVAVCRCQGCQLLTEDGGCNVSFRKRPSSSCVPPRRRFPASSADCQAILQAAVSQGNCSAQACPLLCKTQFLKAGMEEGAHVGPHHASIVRARCRCRLFLLTTQAAFCHAGADRVLPRCGQLYVGTDRRRPEPADAVGASASVLRCSCSACRTGAPSASAPAAHRHPLPSQPPDRCVPIALVCWHLPAGWTTFMPAASPSCSALTAARRRAWRWLHCTLPCP